MVIFVFNHLQMLHQELTMIESEQVFSKIQRKEYFPKLSRSLPEKRARSLSR